MVCNPSINYYGLIIVLHSGLSLMPGMTLQQMPITPLFHAWQEGIQYIQPCGHYIDELHVIVVSLFSYSTQKIVGLSTIDRTQHSTAQTRELECTKTVLPQVISRGKVLAV